MFTLSAAGVVDENMDAVTAFPPARASSHHPESPVEAGVKSGCRAM
jgi:hypothetical protein